MFTEIKNVDQIVRHLNVMIDKETYEADFQKAKLKFAKKVQIDGFRKGKAPMSVIEKRYHDDIKEYYVEEYVEKYYREAVSALDVKILSQPQFHDISFNEDGTVLFVFEYESLPEGFTYEYKDLDVAFKPIVYTENLLEETITKTLNDNAEETPFNEEDKLQIGDKVTLELAESKDTIPAFILNEVNLKRHIDTDINDVVGKGLNDTFTGVRAAENNEDGTPYPCIMKIVDAFKISVPELNDETAKILGHDSVEAMRNSLTETLKKNIDDENENILNQHISRAFGQKNIDDICIPDDFMKHYGKRTLLSHLGGQYDEDILERFPDNFYLEIAERNKPEIVWDLAYEQVAKDHGISVSDEELDQEILRYALEFNISLEEFKEKYSHSLDTLKEGVLSKKVIGFIKPYCIITEPETTVVSDSVEE